MKLKDVFRLPGRTVFGPNEKLGFEKDWFPDIIELEYGGFDLDETALALTGRLTALRIVEAADGYGDCQTRIVSLWFEGQPIALHGRGYNGTHYLHVAVPFLYKRAEALVRSFLKARQGSLTDAVDPETDFSVSELFGFEYSAVSDWAVEQVRKTFGEAAEDMLGYDALPRTEAHLQMDAGFLLNGEAPKEPMNIIFFASAEVPAEYVIRTGAWFKRQRHIPVEELRYGPLEGFESAWVYARSDSLPAGQTTDIARI